MMGRMSSQLRSLLITATNAVPASDPQPARHRRSLPGRHLERYSVYGTGFTAGGVIPSTVQPPTGLTARRSDGNMMMLSWNPPALGPAADSYLLEGSLAPGARAGRRADRQRRRPPSLRRARRHVLPAPARDQRRPGEPARQRDPGLRQHAATSPSAPSNFQARGEGRTLFAGLEEFLCRRRAHEPADGHHRHVTASVPLPSAKSSRCPTSTTARSPSGCGRVNAAGASSADRIGVPHRAEHLLRPAARADELLRPRVGNAVVMAWDAPAGGTPATSYQILVSGTYSGTFPTPAPRLCRRRPRRHLRLECARGQRLRRGPATAFQTVMIP